RGPRRRDRGRPRGHGRLCDQSDRAALLRVHVPRCDPRGSVPGPRRPRGGARRGARARARAERPGGPRQGVLTRPVAWLGIAVVAAVLLALGVRWNAARFADRLARESREMWRDGSPARPLARERLESLPDPVRAYLAKALGERESPVATVRFRHGGRF